MNNKVRNEKEATARRLEAERLAVKAREKEVLDKQQNALRRQKEFREKTQIWNEQILPRWHEMFQGDNPSRGLGWAGMLGSGRSAKVRDLCHKGIPPNIRGKVWPLMIRNDLKINGEIFEHLNRKVIQIYGVNLTASKPAHPEDQKHPAVSPVYRDSFLGLFDEGHPLYPRDNSPAAKGGMKFARDTNSLGREATQGKSGRMFRLNNNLLNNPQKLEPEQRDRTISVMKRAQSLSSLASLVTSEKDTAFTVRVGNKALRNATDAEENGSDGPESASEIVDTIPFHPPCADITEEAWFQNERNGSLDQSAFEYVQKQLFLGTEQAAERTRSTEYIGPNSPKAPYFSPLDIVVEEDVPVECAVEPVPAGTVETLRETPSTPTRNRDSSTNFPSRPSMDFEFSPVRPRANSAAPDSPQQVHRRKLPDARLSPLSKPTGAVMLKSALTGANNQSQAQSHSQATTEQTQTTKPSPAERGVHKHSRKGASRPSELLSKAEKVNDSFFNSSSDESEAGSDDDVIPHIIPSDIPERSRSNSMESDPLGEGYDNSTALNTHSNAHISTENMTEADVLMNVHISPIKIDRTTSSSRSFTPSRLSPLQQQLHALSYSPGNSNHSRGHLHALDTSYNENNSTSWDSGYHSQLHSSATSPHGTPPPRTKHSEEYLVGAGLLASTSYMDDTHTTSKPVLIRESSGSNSHRLRLMLPPSAHSPHSSAHASHALHAAHAHAGAHPPRAAHSPSQSRHASYNSRSYSRQSIEDILHNALRERETESSAFAPTSSRFSFQSSSLTARLGSLEGSAVLLSDEPIFVQDDNYFHTPATPLSPTQDPNNGGGNGDSKKDNNTAGANGVSAGAGVATGIAAVGVSSVNSPTTGPGSKDNGANNLSAAATEQLINSMSLIEWDLPRTYPTLGFFHDGGPMHTGLERVLMCYVCYRPDVGYVQGMSYIVATLLLYMDEFEAFKCMANLLGRKMNMDFYCLQKEAIDSYVHCFNFFFEKMLPLLYEHFRNEGVTSEMFLLDWMLSIFTKTLPLEVAAHIWDVYLFEGEMYLMCVALGILKLYAPRLSMLTMERVSPFLLHLPEDIKPDELFNCIAQIKLSRKRYDRIRLKMAIKCYGSLEAYQKSFANQQNPNFEFSDGGFSPTSPNSNSGLSTPSAHVINTTPVKASANTANKNNNNTRRNTASGGTIRTFGRSIIDTLTGKWGNNQSAITNNSNTTVQRANTNVGAAVAPSKAATVASNRRASTGTHTASP